MKRLSALYFVLVLVVVLFIASISYAGCKLVCDARYGVGYGYSQPYRCEVEFYMGEELMKATGRYNQFTPRTLYALIWFAKDQVAIIKMRVGSNFNTIDDSSREEVLKWLTMVVPGSVGLKGTDQQGKEWHLVWAGR